MNDIQLYEYYLSKPIGFHNRELYNLGYVRLVFCSPHPHRHYSFEEFIDKLESDPEFRKYLEN